MGFAFIESCSHAPPEGYTFARIGAVVNLKVEDYYPSVKRFLLRLKEKGGKEHEMPAHRQIEETIDEYLSKVSIGDISRCFRASIKQATRLAGVR